MKIIIVGGGRVGFYLAQTLIASGHEIQLIEKSLAHCTYVADRLDISVIHGDGTSLATLRRAETAEADILVAVTGLDEDNFVVCQMAKRYFHIKRTIAKANNPKNVEVMRQLAADMVVSNTKIITDLIEQEVDMVGMKFITRMNLGKLSICEYVVKDNDKLNGNRVMDIKFPRNSLLIALQRGDQSIIPKGDTVLMTGDDIMIVSPKQDSNTLQKLFA
ncbi:MAG TPA: NAD-binding protein [Firmicutes bacterium]|nr:NAD-binding protein [Bacillota bacterium]